MSDLPEKREDQPSSRRDRIIIFWMTTGLATLLAAILGGLATGILQIRDGTPEAPGAGHGTSAPASTATSTSVIPSTAFGPEDSTTTESRVTSSTPKRGRLDFPEGLYVDLDNHKVAREFSPDMELQNYYGIFVGDQPLIRQ